MISGNRLERGYFSTFAWQCSKRLSCSGLSEHPAKKCLTCCVWSWEDGGERAGGASSRSAEFFFHKRSLQQSVELCLPFSIWFFDITEFYQSKNEQWYYVFFKCFEPIFYGHKVLQSHYALVHFHLLPSHLLNYFETQVLLLNLAGAKGLKNNYVLTSSRKREYI